MLTLTTGKKAAMDRLSTKDGIISALAIDQRGGKRHNDKKRGFVIRENAK